MNAGDAGVRDKPMGGDKNREYYVMSLAEDS